MKSGKLWHLITLQSPFKGTKDAVGQPVVTWKDEVTDWAELRPLTTREQFIAAQRNASTTHFVSLRWRPSLSALNAAWRVKYRDRIFAIDGPPKNVEERNIEIQLACTEGMTDG